MSLDLQNFFGGINELKLHFGVPLPQGTSTAQADLIDSYYLHLQEIEDEIYNKAIDHLIETRRRRGKDDFPTLSEINEAIEFVMSRFNLKPKTPEFKCDKCYGMGRVIRDLLYADDPSMTPRPMAVYCSCVHGTRLREAHMKAFKKNNLVMPPKRHFRVVHDDEPKEVDPY